jgi:phospholipid/cholesterol/gamma-HCH transport system substrate-binding protein
VEIINGPISNPATKDDPLRGTSPISVGHVLTKADQITSKTLKTIDFVQDFIDTNEREIHAGVAELKALTLEAKDILGRTMGNVDALLGRVDKLTKAAEGDIAQTLAGLRTFAEEINADREEIASLIQDVTDDLDQLVTRSTPAIEESVGNFQEVSEDLRASTRRVGQHIEDLNKSISQLVTQLSRITASSDQKLQKGLDDFGSSAAALNEIADRVDGLVAEIESGRGTLGKLIADEDGYSQIGEAIVAGKRAADDVSTTTRNLNHKLEFFGAIDTRKSYELTYNRLSRSLQNQFTFSLARPQGQMSNPSPYFYLAGLSVRESKLTSDLQVGRKFGDMMARVGSIRSKAGMGLDYWPFSGRVGISLEGIDITDKQPELDLSVAIRLLSSLYFIFGAEDLTGSEVGFNFGLRAVSGN